MDEITMIESGIILTDLFGQLQIKAVILDYDYPRAFITSDLSDSHYYAFLENDDAFEHFGWIVSPVDLHDINRVNLGEKNLQSLFLNRDSYLVKGSISSDICNVEQIPIFDGHNRIEGNLFIPGFCDMDEAFDYHSLSMNAKIHKTSSISLIVEGENGQPRTGDIFKAIKNLQELCKNLDNPIDINDSTLSVQAASTVLTFSFEERSEGELPNISNYTNHDKINELGNFLSGMEPEELINDAGYKSKKVLKKYLNFMTSINGAGDKTSKIVVASPSKEKAVSFKFNADTLKQRKRIVNSACKILKTSMAVETKEILVSGMLTGILTGDDKRFSFVDSKTGYKYDGTVDFDLISSGVPFIVKGGESFATIKVTTTKKGEDTIKESYRLMRIEQTPSMQPSLF